MLVITVNSCFLWCHPLIIIVASMFGNIINLVLMITYEKLCNSQFLKSLFNLKLKFAFGESTKSSLIFIGKIIFE